MNNKYQQLAHEATQWCEKHAKGTPTAREWEEKFAELIVQECTYAINSIMDYTVYEDTKPQLVELKAMRAASAVIKDHFGVK